MSGARVILNPKSGQKGGLTVNATGPDEVRAAIAAAGFEASIVASRHAGHATELARAAIADGCATVIAAGGDGTAREVIAALVGTNVRLGLLPLGSAMNTVRALGIPQDLDEAVRLVQRAERVERIDIGTVAGETLVEAGGVGVSAGVFHLLCSIDSGRWDRVRTLITYLRRTRSTRVTLETDGRQMEYRTLSLIVANAPYTGARVTVAPGALMNDALYEVKVFLSRTKVQLAASWLRLILGRSERLPRVAELRARTVRVTARRPLLVHADDVLVGRTPATFELLPAAVTVIAGPQAPGLDAATAAPTDR